MDAAAAGMPLAEGIVAAHIDIAGVPCIACSPSTAADSGLLIWLHGGGYRVGSALSYRSFGSHLAAAYGLRVILPDYALAPEQPFPAALDEATAVVREILAQEASRSEIFLAGDSAGGGLAVSCAVAVTKTGSDLSGIICASPWADLTNSAPSYVSRGPADRLFSASIADEAAAMYLGNHDRLDPRVSPVYADLRGLPPMLILVGGAEVLLDDSHGLARAAAESGVDVTLRIFPEMPHVWLFDYPAFPEAVEAFDLIGGFIRTRGRRC
jgi:acetyl esterase/lipase